jgi:hypothetical protein
LRHETCQPADVVEEILAAGARLVLIILDTCYSGAGVAAGVLEAADLAGRSTSSAHVWLGVLASSQSYEKAVAGRFAEALLSLLRDGPATPEFRNRWSPRNPCLYGSALESAARSARWGERLAALEWLRCIERWQDRGRLEQ